MQLIKLSLLSIIFAVIHAKVSPKAAPSFPETYHVTGYVDLPYAELHEKFEFWVLSNDTYSASRLDWYDGLDSVFELPTVGSYGTTYQLSYTTLGGSVSLGCFEMSGGSSHPVEADRVLPNLAGFQYGGQVSIFGQSAEMMFLTDKIGYKENTYKFYYKQSGSTATPILFSFLGYDQLMGSHYDRYDIIYSSFDEDVPDNTFDVGTVVDESSCGGFPGPGASSVEQQIMLRPMHDLVRSSRFDDAHAEFEKHFNKSYWSDVDRSRGQMNYMQNVRLIHSKNRQALKYKLEVNHMTDMSKEERRAFMGYRRIQDGRVPKGLKVGPGDLKTNDSLPDSWDWRIYGAVTQVKDQAICGSCWSFGSTGTMEGAYFLRYGHLARLSQQNLIDCSWPEGNDGCDGGEDWRSYEYIQSSTGGLMTEYDYGHYLGQNGKCHFNQSQSVISIANYTFVTGEDEDTVKQALVTNGPLSISIDASLSTFSFYSHGIYDDPDCGNGLDDLDHSVTLVGYGSLSGTKYWLVKNSWSTYWGNLGYVTFAMDDNVCGVMTIPTYVTLA